MEPVGQVSAHLPHDTQPIIWSGRLSGVETIVSQPRPMAS